MRDTSGRLWLVLRVGAAMCFIGHGAFGVIGKEAWLPFFAVVGIGPDLAWRLMPAVGVLDIVMGILALISPRPIVFAYMAVWALWTAALRPLSGDSPWQLVERAGNFGVPFALLVASLRPRNAAGWLQPTRRGAWSPVDASRVTTVLVATTALLLLGHGMLGVAGTPLLGDHYAALGFPRTVTPIVGVAEVAVAVLLVVRPSAGLAAGIALWKIATESLFLAAGAPLWELVERGGSYAAPFGLALLLRHRDQRNVSLGASAMRTASVLAALLLGTSGLAHAQSSDSVFPIPAQRAAAMDDSALLRSLRAGGLVLACRHEATDDGSDANGTNYDDRASQRNLTDTGRERARVTGLAIRAAKVPVGDVWASPMWRTTESAQLTFGDARPTTLLRERHDPRATRALFADPVPAGTNRVLMTHTGTLNRILGRTGLTPVPEGGCIVLRPGGEHGVTGLGLVKATDWQRLRR